MEVRQGQEDLLVEGNYVNWVLTGQLARMLWSSFEVFWMGKVSPPAEGVSSLVRVYSCFSGLFSGFWPYFPHPHPYPQILSYLVPCCSFAADPSASPHHLVLQTIWNWYHFLFWEYNVTDVFCLHFSKAFDEVSFHFFSPQCPTLKLSAFHNFLSITLLENIPAILEWLIFVIVKISFISSPTAPDTI